MNSNSLSNIYSKTRIKNYPSPFKKKDSLQDPKTNDSRVKKRVKRIISTRVLPSLSNNFTIMLGESSSLPVSPCLSPALLHSKHSSPRFQRFSMRARARLYTSSLDKSTCLWSSDEMNRHQSRVRNTMAAFRAPSTRRIEPKPLDTSRLHKEIETKKERKRETRAWFSYKRRILSPHIEPKSLLSDRGKVGYGPARESRRGSLPNRGSGLSRRLLGQPTPHLRLSRSSGCCEGPQPLLHPSPLPFPDDGRQRSRKKKMSGGGCGRIDG